MRAFIFEVNEPYQLVYLSQPHREELVVYDKELAVFHEGVHLMLEVLLRPGDDVGEGNRGCATRSARATLRYDLPSILHSFEWQDIESS